MTENRPTDVIRSCDTCRFWRFLRPKLGECRRYAPDINPRSTPDIGSNATWVRTEGREWCGEWKPEGRHQ